MTSIQADERTHNLFGYSLVQNTLNPIYAVSSSTTTAPTSPKGLCGQKMNKSESKFCPGSARKEVWTSGHLFFVVCQAHSQSSLSMYGYMPPFSDCWSQQPAPSSQRFIGALVILCELFSSSYISLRATLLVCYLGGSTVSLSSSWETSGLSP